MSMLSIEAEELLECQLLWKRFQRALAFESQLVQCSLMRDAARRHREHAGFAYRLSSDRVLRTRAIVQNASGYWPFVGSVPSRDEVFWSRQDELAEKYTGGSIALDD